MVQSDLLLRHIGQVVKKKGEMSFSLFGKVFGELALSSEISRRLWQTTSNNYSKKRATRAAQIPNKPPCNYSGRWIWSNYKENSSG